MKQLFLVPFVALALSAVPLRAEFLQIDLSIFGMD
jgi:hypothetical protein